MKHKSLLISYKIFFALLGFSAIITEIVALTERGVFTPVNFFSYFTIQTNILVFVTLLASALFLAANKDRHLDVLRSAVTVYILIVGIGFAVLLSGLEGLILTAVPWDNVVLHYIIPIAVLIDFMIDRPRRIVSVRRSFVWLLFPFIYAIYALTRGTITGWYPYPFLNPATNGLGAVIVSVLGLLILGLLLVLVIVLLTKKDVPKNA